MLFFAGIGKDVRQRCRKENRIPFSQRQQALRDRDFDRPRATTRLRRAGHRRADSCSRWPGEMRISLNVGSEGSSSGAGIGSQIARNRSTRLGFRLANNLKMRGLGIADELRNRHAERVGDLPKNRDRGHALSSFDLAQHRAADAGCEREGVKGVALTAPNISQTLADDFCNARRSLGFCGFKEAGRRVRKSLI